MGAAGVLHAEPPQKHGPYYTFWAAGIGAISLLTCAGAKYSRRCVEGRMARIMAADPAECCAGQGVGGPQQEAGGARG